MTHWGTKADSQSKSIESYWSKFGLPLAIPSKWLFPLLACLIYCTPYRRLSMFHPHLWLLWVFELGTPRVNHPLCETWKTLCTSEKHWFIHLWTCSLLHVDALRNQKSGTLHHRKELLGNNHQGELKAFHITCRILPIKLSLWIIRILW